MRDDLEELKGIFDSHGGDFVRTELYANIAAHCHREPTKKANFGVSPIVSGNVQPHDV